MKLGFLNNPAVNPALGHINYDNKAIVEVCADLENSRIIVNVFSSTSGAEWKMEERGGGSCILCKHKEIDTKGERTVRSVFSIPHSPQQNKEVRFTFLNLDCCVVVSESASGLIIELTQGDNSLKTWRVSKKSIEDPLLAARDRDLDMYEIEYTFKIKVPGTDISDANDNAARRIAEDAAEYICEENILSLSKL